MSEKLIKIGEAAKLLGVSVDTLRRWDATGEFPSYMRTEGGVRFYQLSVIENRISGEK